MRGGKGSETPCARDLCECQWVLGAFNIMSVRGVEPRNTDGEYFEEEFDRQPRDGEESVQAGADCREGLCELGFFLSETVDFEDVFEVTHCECNEEGGRLTKGTVIIYARPDPGVCDVRACAVVALIAQVRG